MSSPESVRYLGGEPSLGSRFLFEVDGVEIGIFASVTGLQVTSRTESIVEGGQNGFTYQLPGRLEWPNIVFTRGLTDADALFDWMSKTAGEGFAAAGNKLTRSTGAITAMSTTGGRLRAWSLEGVFPVRWTGPDFAVVQDNPLTEELEVAHHGFRSSAPSR
ncbi:MAG: phage tail protein [Nakamurella sp.]